MSDEDVSKKVAAMAKELDKASGESIIERVLTGQVLLQRENAEIRLKLDRFSEGMRLLTDLVERNRLAIEHLSKPKGEIIH
jgi:hypothetical protein